MKFLYYDIGFLVIFGIGLILFLYFRRNNLKREGIMYLYKTNIGIKIIDYIGTKYKKILNVLSYFVVGLGYVLMGVMLYLLFQLVWMFSKPEFVKIIKVPPLMPLIPYIPSVFKLNFLPPFYFTYWIIAIAIIAISHEFSHGIFARLYNIRVKSTGFGFLGPFLAAFVEPDEKQMKKAKIFPQLSILSAGSFANVIMTILFFLIMLLFFMAAYAPAGAIFDNYIGVKINILDIDQIGGMNITDNSVLDYENLKVDFILAEKLEMVEIVAGGKIYFNEKDNIREQFESNVSEIGGFYDLPAIKSGLRGTIIKIDETEIKTMGDLGVVLSGYKPGDEIKIQTRFNNTIENYGIILGESPDEEERAILGIGVRGDSRKTLMGRVFNFFNFFRKPGTEYLPKFNGNLIIFIYNLLWWIVLINISVALFNMLPVGIFDGGRVFYLSVLGLTKSEKTAKTAFKLITWIILGIFILLMMFWVVGYFG